MLLADSFILVIGGLFLVGFIGFFVMAVALAVRFFGFIVRSAKATGRKVPVPSRLNERHDVCPHARCGHVNRFGAHYCARCGRALGRQNDIDAYG